MTAHEMLKDILRNLTPYQRVATLEMMKSQAIQLSQSEADEDRNSASLHDSIASLMIADPGTIKRAMECTCGITETVETGVPINVAIASGVADVDDHVQLAIIAALRIGMGRLALDTHRALCAALEELVEQ